MDSKRAKDFGVDVDVNVKEQTETITCRHLNEEPRLAYHLCVVLCLWRTCTLIRLPRSCNEAEDARTNEILTTRPFLHGNESSLLIISRHQLRDVYTATSALVNEMHASHMSHGSVAIADSTVKSATLCRASPFSVLNGLRLPI